MIEIIVYLALAFVAGIIFGWYKCGRWFKIDTIHHYHDRDQGLGNTCFKNPPKGKKWKT